MAIYMTGAFIEVRIFEVNMAIYSLYNYNYMFLLSIFIYFSVSVL